MNVTGQKSATKGRTRSPYLRNTKSSSVAPALNARNPDEIQNMIKNKADLSDLQHMMDVKSNKIDTENNMRCVDILHRQIEHVIVLMVELIKTNLS